MDYLPYKHTTILPYCNSMHVHFAHCEIFYVKIEILLKGAINHFCTLKTLFNFNDIDHYAWCSESILQVLAIYSFPS